MKEEKGATVILAEFEVERQTGLAMEVCKQLHRVGWSEDSFKIESKSGQASGQVGVRFLHLEKADGKSRSSRFHSEGLQVTALRNTYFSHHFFRGTWLLFLLWLQPILLSL